MQEKQSENSRKLNILYPPQEEKWIGIETETEPEPSKKMPNPEGEKQSTVVKK